jgi:hypothetical protein
MIENCSNCDKKFSCNASSEKLCWCNKYPAVLEHSDGKNCLCDKCLHLATKCKVEEIAKNFTADQALHKNWIKDLPKSKNVIEGIDYYVERELYVFTKWHHLKRGYCCNNNCRHCGYK